MNRRDFIRRLALAGAAVAIGPAIGFASEPTLAPVVDSAWLQVGDVFTIAGWYEFDPVTREPTNRLKQWVVTDSAVSSTRPFLSVEVTRPTFWGTV